MPRRYLNNMRTTLAANIGTGATTIELPPGVRAQIVAITGAISALDPLIVSVEQGTTREIMSATGGSGDSLTVTRAVEAVFPDAVPTPYAFTAGAVVSVRATAASYAGGGVVLPASSFGVFANVAGLYARGNGSDITSAIGAANASNNGTLTGRAYSNSVFGAQTRSGYVSVAAINSPAGRTVVGHGYTPATEANAQPFVMRAAVGVSDAAFQSTAALFFGAAGTGGSVGDPGALTTTQHIGIGASPSDANLSLYHSNGGGTVTKTGLGSNFPANTTNTDWYEIELVRAAGTYAWAWRVRNVTNGQVAQGTATTNVPNAAIIHSWHISRNTLTGTAAVGLDFSYFVVGYGSAAIAA